MIRRALLPVGAFLALALTCHSALAASADAYPTRPIRLVVPYAPGGGSDVMARMIGQKIGESLGQTVVVDNRPGAASMIGTVLVAKALPDGYTLLLADAAFTINRSYYAKQAHYDPQADFVPIALIADTPYILMTHPQVPAATIKDFIALARAQPGKINIGSSGNGSGSHLMVELFKLKAGVNLNHIPYKGAGPSTADVMAGQIQGAFAGAAGVIALVKSGRLKALVQAAPKRSPNIPDVATFPEAGFPDLIVSNWYGIAAPARTPQPVVKRLYDEIGRAVATADVKERLAAAALEPVPQSPDRFRQLIDIEVKRWAQVIRDANIQTE